MRIGQKRKLENRKWKFEIRNSERGKNNAEDAETRSSQRRAEKREMVWSDFGFVEVLPRSLHCVADTPNDGAAEKVGHSGRDDGGKREKRRRARCIVPLQDWCGGH